VISDSVMCCGCQGDDDVMTWLSASESSDLMLRHENEASSSFVHPRDSHIALSKHAPLCLPGNIIHVVRNHPPEYVPLLALSSLVSERRRYCGARHLCVCMCVCPPSRDCTSQCRVILGGEGNALYPVLCSYILDAF